METSPLYELLFDSDSVPNATRIPLDGTNCKQLGGFAREVRDAIQTTVEVIAALNSCARSKEIPPAVLEVQVTQVIDELHQFVRTLDEFEDHAEMAADPSLLRH